MIKFLNQVLGCILFIVCLPLILISLVIMARALNRKNAISNAIEKKYEKSHRNN